MNADAFNVTSSHVQVTGELARYGSKPAQLLFLNGTSQDWQDCKGHFVLVGGLTDGLLPAPFVHALSQRLQDLRWRLVQTQLETCFNVRTHVLQLHTNVW